MTRSRLVQGVRTAGIPIDPARGSRRRAVGKAPRPSRGADPNRSGAAAWPFARLLDGPESPNPASTTADALDRLQASLKQHFEAVFGDREALRLQAMLDAAEHAITTIARTDAPYHNREHTLLVCQVGQQILNGKHALGDTISAQQWVNYIVSLLFHDIGYVKDALPGDIAGSLVADGLGAWVQLPSGATDAFLTPLHVDRGVAYVRQFFANNSLIDAEVLAVHIENTRFPPPQHVRDRTRSRHQWRDLVPAADLIGQLADPGYLQKLPALYAEFLECGVAQATGLAGPADLVRQFPRFYRELVASLVEVGFEALEAVPEGRLWGESLRATIARCQGYA